MRRMTSRLTPSISSRLSRTRNIRPQCSGIRRHLYSKPRRSFCVSKLLMAPISGLSYSRHTASTSCGVSLDRAGKLHSDQQEIFSKIWSGCLESRGDQTESLCAILSRGCGESGQGPSQPTTHSARFPTGCNIPSSIESSRQRHAAVSSYQIAVPDTRTCYLYLPYQGDSLGVAKTCGRRLATIFGPGFRQRPEKLTGCLTAAPASFGSLGFHQLIWEQTAAHRGNGATHA